MMRATILALSLVCAQAHALGPYKCRPAQMFGAGGSAATISIGQASSCAVWMCGDRVQIVACVADHCTDAALNAAWWVWDRGLSLGYANAALAKCQAGSICEPSVRAVWWPDRYKLKSVLGMSDDQVAAICPAK